MYNATTMYLSTTPQPTAGNCSSRLDIDCIIHNLEHNNSSIFQLFAVIAAAFLWFLYLAYYNSRLLGYALPKIFSYLIPEGTGIHIGSISISVLSGKLMFRDVLYTTNNFALHINDGYCIVHWWKLFNPKTLRAETEFTDQDNRLTVSLTAYQLYVYNTSEKYDDLQDLYGKKFGESNNTGKSGMDSNQATDAAGVATVSWWRTLFPAINWSISEGSLTFGNNFLPNSLLVTFSEAQLCYKTTKASNSYDVFMHVLDGDVGTLSISLVPSCNYDANAKIAFLNVDKAHNDEPPRKMGEGYVIMRSTGVKIKQYYDEPGEMKPLIEEDCTNYMTTPLIDNNNDSCMQVPNPIFDCFIRCSKRTSLNYGPWADRQRDLLVKFFYPHTYQNHQAEADLQQASSPTHPRLRKTPLMNLSISFLHESDLDILFLKDDKIRVLNINARKGSFLDVVFPFVIDEKGYEVVISGQLLHADTSTNMDYRHLLKAETLQFKFTSSYPIHWNDVIEYRADITVTKTSLSYLFAHNHFFSELIDDWSKSSPRPDVCTFVPYKFTFYTLLEDVELLLPCNSYNWVDTSSKTTENELIALHAETLTVDFCLPFDAFCPPTYTLPVSFHADNLHLCIHLQTSNPTWYSLLNLAANQSKWRRTTPNFSCCTSRIQTLGSHLEWVKCWIVPVFDLHINYTWHSDVEDTISFKPQWDFTLLEKRHRSHKSLVLARGDQCSSRSNSMKNNAEAKSSHRRLPAPDVLEVDLRVNDSSLLLYGPLLKLFINAKENYIGVDDIITDVTSSEDAGEKEEETKKSSSSNNKEDTRPFKVVAKVKLNNTSGYLPVYPKMLDEPPRVFLKSLKCVVASQYHETDVKLQLAGLSIGFADNVAVEGRSFRDDLPGHRHQKGRLHLNQLNFDLVAYLSDGKSDLTFPATEYACMTSITVGTIAGMLSVAEAILLSEWAELFTTQLSNEDHKLKQTKLSQERMLQSTMELRYTELHVTTACIQLMLCISESFIFQLDIPCVSVCAVKGYTDDTSMYSQPRNNCSKKSNHNEVGSVESTLIHVDKISLLHRICDRSSSGYEYVDAGQACVGPLAVHIAEPVPQVDLLQKQKFVKEFDRSTKRIQQIWKSTGEPPHNRVANENCYHTQACFHLLPCLNQQAFRRYVSAPTGDDVIDEMESGSRAGDATDSLMFTDPGQPAPTPSSELNVTEEDTLVASTSPTTTTQNDDDDDDDDDPSFFIKSRRQARRRTATSSDELAAPLSSASSSGEVYYSAESDLNEDNDDEFVSGESIALLSDKSAAAASPPTAVRNRLRRSSTRKKLDEVDAVVEAPGGISTQRPATLRILEHMKPRTTPKLTRLPSQRTHSVDMLGGSGAYENGCVDELALAYRPLLSVSRLRKRSKLLSSLETDDGGVDAAGPTTPTWLPGFDPVKPGIYFPSAVQSKSRVVADDCLRDDDSDLVQKIRVSVKIQDNIELQITPILLLGLQRLVKGFEKSIESSMAVSIISRIRSKCLSKAADLCSKQSNDIPTDVITQCCVHTPPQTSLQVHLPSITAVFIQASSGNESVFSRQLQGINDVPCYSALIVRLGQLSVSMKQYTPMIEINSMIDTRDLTPTEIELDLKTFDCQLRILTHDGHVPDVISITALDESCSDASFHIHPPTSVTPMFGEDVYNPFGWVVIEAGGNAITFTTGVFQKGIPPFSSRFEIGDEQLDGAENLGMDGKLSVSKIWSNLASKSLSQVVRPGALQWNSVTSLAVTCHAWMTPIDRLSHAISKVEACMTRKNTEVCAAVFVSTLEQLQTEIDHPPVTSAPTNAGSRGGSTKAKKENVGPRLLDMNMDDKLGIITPMSKRLREFRSFALMNVVTRFLVIAPDEQINAIEQALRHVTTVPRLVTLRPAIHILTRYIHDKLDNGYQSKKSKSNNNQQPVEEPVAATSNDINSSFISIMKNIEALDFDQKVVSEFMVTYGLLFECINMEEPDESATTPDIIQMLLHKGLRIKVDVKEIGINKHPCNEKVLKSRLQRNKEERNSLASGSLSDNFSPCLCSKWRKGDQFSILSEESKSSQSDQLVVFLWLEVDIEFSTCQNEDINSGMFKVQTETANSEESKAKEMLDYNLSVSSKLICQNIDSRIFHLLHEAIETFTVLSEMRSDMEVRKFRGRLSANPSVRMVETPGVVPATNGGRGLPDRRWSPLGRTFENDSLPGLSEDATMSRCWQIIYKLVDDNHGDLCSRERNNDGMVFNYKITEDPKNAAILNLNARFNIKRVEVMTAVEDFKVVLQLKNIGVNLNHSQQETRLIKFKNQTEFKAKISGVYVECRRDGRDKAKIFITAEMGCSTVMAMLSMKNDMKVKSNSHNKKQISLNVSKIAVELCEHLGSLCDELLYATTRISSQSQRFLENKFVVSKEAVKDLASPVTAAAPGLFDSIFYAFTPAPTSSNISFSKDLPQANEEDDIPNKSISFKGSLDNMQISLSILPSVTSKYQAKNIEVSGELSHQSTFAFALPEHQLDFHVKNSVEDKAITTPISLPNILSTGRMDKVSFTDKSLGKSERDDVKISIHLGSHEQTVTTDLVNQLIFLKTLSTNEIQDVIEKMSKFQQNDAVKLEIPVSDEEAAKRMIYHVDIQFEGIQLTVTTPSNNAVRLKTSRIIFEFSNTNQSNKEKIPKYLTLFGKADIDMSVALGTFVLNSVYAEAEAEFQQTGYFTTRISLKNSSQSPPDSENVSRMTLEDSEQLNENTILISLLRPLFFVQPTAFDKAILIFVAYKSAYEKWLEKNKYLRDNLHKTKTIAAPTLTESKSTSNPAYVSFGHFFLQLSLHDLGVCLPIPDSSEKNGELMLSDELSLALVLTIDQATISACIAKSIVTQGDFSGFSLRFVNDFQPSLDDWTLDITYDPATDELAHNFDMAPYCYGVAINAFTVPQGSYKICTDTSSYHTQADASDACLPKVRNCISVVWNMKGMSFDIDYKIGGYISRLVKMLTAITAGRENLNFDLTAWGDNNGDDDPNDYDVTPGMLRRNSSLLTPAPQNRSHMSDEEMVAFLQNEYQKQSQTVRDLREVGVRSFVLEDEMRNLHKIEKQLAQYFRLAVRNRLKGKESFSRNLTTVRTPSRHGTFRWTDRSRSNTVPDDVMDKLDELDEGSRMTQEPIEVHEKSVETDIETILNIRVEMEEGKIVCHHELNQDDKEILERRKNCRIFRYICELDKESSFFVPGVKMRLHYGSAHGLSGQLDMESEDPRVPRNSSFCNLPQHPGAGDGCKDQDQMPKKGLVCLWLYIQSLPKTVVHPHFLDFLEKLLSQLPLSTLDDAANIEVQKEEEEEQSNVSYSAGEGFDSEMISLPVDVMAYIDIQPSEVRFTCLPSSHVECWIQIPRLDAAFSNTTNFVMDESSPENPVTFNKEKATHGLSFTAVLSDFSVKIFHLYGTQPMESGAGGAGAGGNAFKYASQSPNHTKIRDFTVSLEVIKFNFVRTRQQVTDANSKFNNSKNINKYNQIDVSLLIDVGKATIVYDVMKLNEIFCIPQAWFKKSLARRLFFGDERNTMQQPTTAANANKERLTPDISVTAPPNKLSAASTEKLSGSTSKLDKEKTPWKGCVICQVNMTQLEVHMSMGNVMGKTLLICNDFGCNTKYDTHPNRDKMLMLSFNLDQASLSAHSGVAGGNIVMNQFISCVQVSSSPNRASQHKLTMQMKKVYGNIDHFGRRIMMGQLTQLRIKLKDSWNLSVSNVAAQSKSSGFVDKNQINIPVHFVWDKFWLAIHRSTTPDVIKMLDKLYQFFEMQVRNSLNAFTPYTSLMTFDNTSSTFSQPKFRAYSTMQEPLYYNTRHWPEVYEAIHDTMNLLRQKGSSSILSSASPQFILGGSVTLRGNLLTIACFNGSYFERSPSWLLFNINKPLINFETEVQQFKESINQNRYSTFCLQTFIFNLGEDDGESNADAKYKVPTATICRVKRPRQQPPPPFTPDLDEWYNYLNVPPECQEVGIIYQAFDQTRSTIRNFSSSSDMRSHSESDKTVQAEMIAGLPKMQLDFKSSHTLAPNASDLDDKSNAPVVDCSFVTDFSDHLSVSMDAELLLYIHNVIRSYWKERNELYRSTVRGNSMGRSTTASGDDQTTDEESNGDDSKSGEPIDLRVFKCNDWQLEPLFRLISWAGNRIEPIGIEHILKLLGFEKARTTIPKWLQRGALDPLDKGLAIAITKLILSCKPAVKSKKLTG